MSFAPTRNDILTTALKKCGVIPVGQLPTAEQLSSAANLLNYILTTEFDFPTNISHNTKTLTSSSQVTGYRCINPHTSTAADQPGVGANYLSYWYPDSLATGSWSLSTSYTAIGTFDLATNVIDVLSAFMKNTDGADYGLLCPLSMYEYESITDKYSTGLPTHFYVDYQLTPRIYLYPQPDNSAYILNYSSLNAVASLDTASSIPSMYKSLYNYLVFRLASDIADEEQLPLSERSYLYSKAETILNNIKRKNFSRNAINNFVEGAY